MTQDCWAAAIAWQPIFFMLYGELLNGGIEDVGRVSLASFRSE